MTDTSEPEVAGAPPPEAILLVAPGCPHCPTAIEHLTRLVKQGRLGRLEIINIAAHPDTAERWGTRSVPWMRIGVFELDGLRSASELAQWVEHAAHGTGFDSYYAELLGSGKLAQVVGMLRKRPGSLPDLIALIGDETTPLAVRIGIGAALEDLQSDGLVAKVVPELAALASHENARVRADAAHYLGLSGDQSVASLLRRLLEDDDEAVRDIAAESLTLLSL